MDQESDLENWAQTNGYWHNHPQEYYKSLGYQCELPLIDGHFKFNTPGMGLGGKFRF